MCISMFWYLQNICLWVWVFIASLARKHRTQTRDYFLLLPAKGAKHPLRGGESSRGETSWGRNVQGANCQRGESSRNVHRSIRKGTPSITPNFSRNRSGEWNKWLSPYKTCDVSETAEDRAKFTINCLYSHRRSIEWFESVRYWMT